MKFTTLAALLLSTYAFMIVSVAHAATFEDGRPINCQEIKDDFKRMGYQFTTDYYDGIDAARVSYACQIDFVKKEDVCTKTANQLETSRAYALSDIMSKSKASRLHKLCGFKE